MKTINFTIPDQYDLFPIDQPVLLVPLPDRWKEFITEGNLKAMLLDYSKVWEQNCNSISDYCLNTLFMLFIDLLFNGCIARRSNDV